MSINSLKARNILVLIISNLLLIPFYIFISLFYIKQNMNLLHYFSFLVISEVLFIVFILIFNKNKLINMFLINILASYIITIITYFIDFNPYTDISNLKLFFINTFCCHSLLPSVVLYNIILYNIRNSSRIVVNIFCVITIYYLIFLLLTGTNNIILDILFFSLLFCSLIYLRKYIVIFLKNDKTENLKIISKTNSETINEEINKIKSLILLGYSNKKIKKMINKYDEFYINEIRKKLLNK